jgi:hypothetical protein
MTRIQDHLSALVFSQIPDFAKVDYPLFAEFLTAYYKFLEQDQKAQEVIQNIQSYGDIDETVEFLISRFYGQFGEHIPDDLSADQRLLLKNLSDMYGSKGTEKGYRFLFNVLYKETIDFFYPQTEILKASDGKWIRTFKLSAFPISGMDPFKFENTQITGDITGATAIVNHVIKYIENGLVVYELSIDPNSMTGNFRSYEKIRASKLIRTDGSNSSFATVRRDLQNSEVFSYYSARINELRGILFFGNASRQVAVRRLANLGIEYSWTDAQVIQLYNDLFAEAINATVWQRINPLVTHLAPLNRNNSYDHYIENPEEFYRIVIAFNASETIIIERILTIARDFGWTSEELVSVVNPSFGRNYVAGDWRQRLLPIGPVYEEISAYLYPMLAEIDVLDPGKGYLPGDVVNITSNTGEGALAEVISVTPTGGIINVRVLESGVNYTTTTQVSAVKLPNNYVTARQLLRGNVASVIFDREHGLKYGDQLTVTDSSAPVATGSNTFVLTVCSAGGAASNQLRGVFVDGLLVKQGNATHTVSIYNTTSMTFVEHITYDLRLSGDVILYDSNVYIGAAEKNNILGNYIVERNLANVAISYEPAVDSNVIYVTRFDQATVFVNNLPSHTSIRLRAKIHLLDNWVPSDRANVVILNTQATPRIDTISRPSNSQDPVFTLNTDGLSSAYFVGDQTYSRSVNSGSIVMDLRKPAGLTPSADCNVVARTQITGLGQQVSVIQSNVAVFGYYSSIENERTLTKNTPFDLTGHTNLIFEANKGGGNWGEVPESGEDLFLEYSIDGGTNWITLYTMLASTEPTGWKLHTVPIPASLSQPGHTDFPLLRFRMPDATAVATPPPPRDCWAVTSIVTSLDALSYNNGYVEYDSGYVPHGQTNFTALFNNSLSGTTGRMLVSNVIISVTTEESIRMADKLNSLNNNEIVTVHTWDDASVAGRLTNGLPEAMERIGAARFAEESSNQSAYSIIGKIGLDPGEAIENIFDRGDSSPNNRGCVTARIDNGNIVGQSVVVGSIPDERTINYAKFGPDGESNVNVYFDDVADLRANIGPLVISDPFWKNNDGKLDENMFVQGRTRLAAEDDPVYYQQFSYVIRTEHPINEWRKHALNIMHPGGIALFGELKLQTIPEDVIDCTPFVVTGVEIQDFFAITADKAQRTSPTSPEFTADMTVFPPPSSVNPQKLTFQCPNFVYSGSKVPTNYVTVECMFVKEKDTSGLPNLGTHILFSKYLSYEMRTNNNRLNYRVMRQGYQWVWVDGQFNLVDGQVYVVHLTYDGVVARMYVDGKFRHQANNRELSLARNGDPGVLANQTRHYLMLNGRNNNPNSPTVFPQTCDNHSFLVFRVYDKALSDQEIADNYQNMIPT